MAYKWITDCTDYSKDILFRIKKGNPIAEIACEVYAQIFRKKVDQLISRCSNEDGKSRYRRNQEDLLYLS